MECIRPTRVGKRTIPRVSVRPRRLVPARRAGYYSNVRSAAAAAFTASQMEAKPAIDPTSSASDDHPERDSALAEPGTGDPPVREAAAVGVSDGRTSNRGAVGSSSHRTRSTPSVSTLPGFLKFLAFYLLTEASVRITSAVLQFSRGTSTDLREDMWNLLLGTFYLLLVPQIFVRTIAARLSLSLVFAIQVMMIVLEIVVRSPKAWSYASTGARAQLLGQVVFYSLVIVLLNRKPISDSFRS